MALEGASGSIGGNTKGIQRLLPNGAQDVGFFLDPLLQVGAYPDATIPTYTPVRVQANNSIVYTSSVIRRNGQSIGRLIRLSSQGGLDNTLVPPPLIANAPTFINSIQLLANGNMLVAGSPGRFGGPSAPLTSVAILQNTGQRDMSFAPNLQWDGRVNAVAQQPDGKLLIGGAFNELNGAATQNIARLNTDGTVDPSFALLGANGEVFGLALQPDGKVVLTGNFTTVGGVARPVIARLLPTGALDAAFVPAMLSTTTFPNELASGGKVVVTNGQVIVVGQVNGGPGFTNGILKFDGATGQLDTNFQPPIIGNFSDILVQPDGKLLLSGYISINRVVYGVCRLLPGGGLDPAFTLTGRTGNDYVSALALDAAGRVYVGGNLLAFGSFPVTAVARLLPDGTFDTAFTSGLPGNQYHQIRTMTIQPNGRLLVGGYLSWAGGAQGTMRLLPDGSVDTSFFPSGGPSWNVLALLVQANGAIVAGGNFTSASGLPYVALYRMLDVNVLGAAAEQVNGILQAWPNPAHGHLQVRLPKQYYPSTINLLDALGRPVKKYSVSGSDYNLNIESVPSGVYFLRVEGQKENIVQKVVID